MNNERISQQNLSLLRQYNEIAHGREFAGHPVNEDDSAQEAETGCGGSDKCYCHANSYYF